MEVLKALLLGIIQGVTEFLPISSSGHLSLFRQLFNVETDTAGLFSAMLHIGTLVAIVTLAFSGKNALILLKKVDYKTIGFFIGLFVVIGGLEQTGILEIVAGFIGKISGGSIVVMLAIILWLSAIASAIVDNIPFATTMIPIIKALSATYGVDLSVLSWTLAMGTDIGGSATPIGASANVVGIATAAREGYIIKWGPYLKKMVPATVIVVVISMTIIYMRYL